MTTVCDRNIVGAALRGRPIFALPDPFEIAFHHRDLGCPRRDTPTKFQCKFSLHLTFG